MSEQQETFEEQGNLPAEFWEQPEALIAQDSLKLVYAEVARRLREDLREWGTPSTLQLMLAERTAALYIHMRQKESSAEGFANDRAYKETIQLWVQMASQLGKTSKGDVDPEEIRRTVLKEVARAIKNVTKDMPADLGRTVRAQLIEAVSA